MAVSCFWATSVTKSGGAGVSGGPSNFRVVNALPSVNSTTVTPLEPSGELPETVVPPVPTLAGPGVPFTESPSFALAESSALAAAEGSLKTRMVSRTTLLPSSLLNVVSTPAWPFGLCVIGPALNSSGALRSLAWISSLV